MNEVEAAAQLQSIRTLMERAALYRRALAPTLLMMGTLGCLAALVGWVRPGQTGAAFATYWLGVAVVAATAGALLMRRQALRAAEPFWTPPARRIAAAMLPPLLAGIAATLPLTGALGDGPFHPGWLPPVWLVFYGLAVHAAGFFTLRGVRWLGAVFVLVGTLLGLVAVFHPEWVDSVRLAHLLMGGTFGLGHLAAGGWLTVVERETAA